MSLEMQSVSMSSESSTGGAKKLCQLNEDQSRVFKQLFADRPNLWNFCQGVAHLTDEELDELVVELNRVERGKKATPTNVKRKIVAIKEAEKLVQRRAHGGASARANATQPSAISEVSQR